MPTIDVAAGLVWREGRLLIAKRHDNAHLGGLWEFPGGKREPNETFEQCLARELREELGIEVAIGELVESLTHEYPEQLGFQEREQHLLPVAGRLHQRRQDVAVRPECAFALDRMGGAGMLWPGTSGQKR